ncbi:phosphatase PAP2 family protein [Roseisolibacter agri]|nr:phosphatase PAP2 family protein [Roseisolibacter agri]
MPAPAAPIARPTSRRASARAAQLATAAAASGALVALALVRVMHDDELAIDRRVQRIGRTRFGAAPRAWLRGRRRSRARLAFDAIGTLSSDWATTIAGIAAGLAVARRHGLARALPVAVAVPATNLAHGAVKYSLREPRPIVAHLTGKHTPSFPSGHAARGAAAAGVLAHVASREGLVPLAVGLPIAAAVALVSGAQRVWIERHWATDAVGGFALGAAVAAGVARLYDALGEA